MKILGIETSCDDTAIAILEITDKKNPNFKVLSNIVSSQVKIHKKYGGVYPTLAKREHQKNLIPVLTRALKNRGLLKSKPQNPNVKSNSKSKFQKIKNILSREPELYKKSIAFFKKYRKPKIDLIAVTQGPGLEPCLWVGINFAKALSFWWNTPIIPVNHIESHILINFANLNSKLKYQNSKPHLKTQKLFPAMCLVVSGGHTQLILMKKIGDYKIIGETRDDAAGECFDKCAKILGLGYPGGPEIARLAQKAKTRKDWTSVNLENRKKTPTLLPRPMFNTKDYDFSFSGLKTAVLYSYQKSKIKNQNYKQIMCAEIQQAIIDVLIKKTLKAAKDYKVKTIILGGGVSANQKLRKQFKEKIEKEIPTVKLLIPDTKYSTDNALMTAITAYFHQNEKIIPISSRIKFKAKPNLRIET